MDDDARSWARRSSDRVEQADAERRTAAIGVDLSRLREQGGFAPVVEYLTAIQTLRGEASSLLFVRAADLDRMAEREGQPVQAFIDRLDQLGVVVSSN